MKRGPKPENLEKRFRKHFQEGNPEECWPWLGNIGNRGYGISRMHLRPISAHRLSFLLLRGPIPDGLWVLHKCDNRKCVNPNHLFLGTRKDNMQDAAQKGRIRNGNLRGSQLAQSKLVESDVIEILLSDQSLPELGRKFGVDKTAIWKVRHRKSWKHVVA